MFPIESCKIEVNPPGFVDGVTQFRKCFYVVYYPGNQCDSRSVIWENKEVLIQFFGVLGRRLFLVFVFFF